MTRKTGISTGWILATLLAAFTFLTLAASGCGWDSDIACFNSYRATLFHHAQE